VLRMLDLAGRPLRGVDRTDGPLVIAGGPCTSNPEPMAAFVDAFVVGDGEHAAIEVAESWKRTDGRPRDERLAALAAVHGVYVPSLYRETRDASGRFAGMAAREGAPMPVQRAVVTDLDAAPYPDAPIVPHIEVVHDRVSLEIARGCTQGCRFCHAGMTCRPVRTRSMETLLTQARGLLAATGHEEVSLLSLSAADHPEIEALCRALLDEHGPSGVDLSLPSTRVDAFSVALAQLAARVRKGGVTLAPEAGTQRLRDVINKRVTDEQIMEAADAAFAAGFGSVKLYFMLGLPTETDEDALGIVDIVRRIVGLAKQRGVKRGSVVNASLAAFVPKPHTPFQWEAQADPETLERRRVLITGALRKVGRADVRWHNPRTARIECALARGGRETAEAIENAYRDGARLDGWDEWLDEDRWERAFARAGLPLAERGAALDPCLPLPWEHIHVGLTRAFLEREAGRAREGITTPDCEGVRCHGCGAGCEVAPRADV